MFDNSIFIALFAKFNKECLLFMLQGKICTIYTAVWLAIGIYIEC